MKIKMIKLIIPLSCLVLLAFSSAQGQHNSDQLYDSFVNPPPPSKAFYQVVVEWRLCGGT